MIALVRGISAPSLTWVRAIYLKSGSRTAIGTRFNSVVRGERKVKFWTQ